MKFVLQIWGLFGGLLVYFFLANFLTVLLRPNYEKPVNSAKDIIDRRMIPFVDDGAYFYRDYLVRSPNPLYQQLGEIVVIPKDYGEVLEMFKNDIQGGTHVYLGVMFSGDYEYGGYSKQDYHTSKDGLEGQNPFGGNILNKAWEYSDAYNHHVLLFHQVG